MKALKLHGAKDKNGSGALPTQPAFPFDLSFPSLFQDPGQWMDRWFRSPGSFPAMPAFKAPAVDVSEDEKEITIKAEVPGMSEKDLEVTFANGILRLRGEKKEEKEEKKKNTWHKESWQGSFVRNIPLGEGVEWKKAEARHKDGVLTVVIPKKPGASENPVKINIQ